MTIMPDPEAYRAGCRIHALRRAAERGLPIGPADLDRLERVLPRLAPLYRRPGVGRYRLTILVNGRRVRIVFDLALCAVVTVMPPREPRACAQRLKGRRRRDRRAAATLEEEMRHGI